MLNKSHPFHLVERSKWPIITAFSLGWLLYWVAVWFKNRFVFSTLVWSHFLGHTVLGIVLPLLVFIFSIYNWFTDIHYESRHRGFHTLSVQKGLKIGFILFICSEIMFFFSFFWAFFHSSLSPSVEIGCMWPPRGVETISPFGLPLLNTAILLSSGASITWCHSSYSNLTLNRVPELTLYQIWVWVEQESEYCICQLKNPFFKQKKKVKKTRPQQLWELEVLKPLLITIFLAILFTLIQVYEYKESYFSFSDGIYGSVFFILTGFHGLHVIVGTIMLTVSYYRIRFDRKTKFHSHIGLELSIWYWHFVDVVWLYLYVIVYYWGNNICSYKIKSFFKLF